MTKLADVTLARSIRQSLELLRAARRALEPVDAPEADHVDYLLIRVDDTLGAGLELYERGRGTHVDGHRVRSS